jgi:hypothetical protein
MTIADHTAQGYRRERLWTWSFWMVILAFEALGLFLAHQA